MSFLYRHIHIKSLWQSLISFRHINLTIRTVSHILRSMQLFSFTLCKNYISPIGAFRYSQFIFYFRSRLAKIHADLSIHQRTTTNLCAILSPLSSISTYYIISTALLVTLVYTLCPSRPYWLWHITSLPLDGSILKNFHISGQTTHVERPCFQYWENSFFKPVSVCVCLFFFGVHLLLWAFCVFKHYTGMWI